jgi:uncharacterized membrane protein YfcA
VIGAGFLAGTINTIVGSGSLITFPTLLAIGYSPVVANVSNNIGMVPGSVFGSFGFRRELAGQKQRARILASSSALGGLTGAILLLVLPSDVFDAIVPILVLLACGLMLVQPRLAAWVAGRRAEGAPDVGAAPLALGYLAGVYGGYFGAAQGVILLAILAVFVPDDLTRSNALKNVLAGTVNAVAAVVFILFADVAWEAVVFVAVGAAVGGTLGARIGRRVPAPVLRGLVVVIGLFVAIRLLVD